jgi:hypothetical protein
LLRRYFPFHVACMSHGESGSNRQPLITLGIFCNMCDMEGGCRCPAKIKIIF